MHLKVRQLQFSSTEGPCETMGHPSQVASISLLPLVEVINLLTHPGCTHLQLNKGLCCQKKHYQAEKQRLMLKLRSCLQKLQGKAEVNLRTWADTLIVFIRPTLLCSPSCDILYTLEVPAYSLSHTLFHL